MHKAIINAYQTISLIQLPDSCKDSSFKPFLERIQMYRASFVVYLSSIAQNVTLTRDLQQDKDFVSSLFYLLSSPYSEIYTVTTKIVTQKYIFSLHFYL